MIAVAAKLCLLASVALLISLENHDVDGAPRRTCYLPKTPENRAAFRTIRNKYEDLRFDGVEPWQNCSEKYLQLPKMDNLTKWEKMGAMELQLNLFIPVLQNQSETTFAKATSEVLEFLLPYREDLKVCMQHRPSHHQESGYLQGFKDGLQQFNTSNTEQSPKCLEAAVGMNILSLLQEIKGISLHHHHQPRHHSNN
uniref:Interferon lambda n=1 Tax=Anolis carolinensis TaxID=28377 RepID=A0A0A0Q1A9_ANOCA|nr:PREDICTED: uncharacterized protein LOC107983691 [Anolis carolinensis]AHY86484.1 interferon lambda [Anolis carolinensis]|eukprot:XP_016853758.1 PREDICTED: uncharacterized protein LOC107983691 [Anolis carolinensis]